jgi:hypothetical protein
VGPAVNLDAALAAYQRGDHGEARRQARATLAATTSTQEDRDQARDLLRTLGPDRAAIIVLCATALFCTGIFLAYMSHG